LTESLPPTRHVERRHAVVLFADIKGYTSLASELDPEDVHAIMQEVYAIMDKAIKAHGGTTTKFIGDSAMALFGVPTAHENDEARAIRCALELHRRIVKHPEVNGRKLALTIGINSGLVVAGELGAATKMDFDALGDTVNIAARLQDKADAGQVFVSERVYRRAAPQFNWERVGPFELKNVPQPVQAYNVVSERDPAEVAEFAGAGMAKLCGRDTEMDEVNELLHLAEHGAGQVLGVTGEAGVGKSRLVYELRANAEDMGFHVLIGRTLSYGQNMPLLPVKEITRLYAGLKEHEDTEHAQQVIRETFSPAWEDMQWREIRVTALEWFLGYPGEDSLVDMLEGKAKQSLLEVTLNEFFLHLGTEKPLVLILEDMHWSDPSTKDWMVQFTRLIKDRPILVVLVYRPGFEYDWSKEERITFSEIALEPIEAQSVGDMVSSILAVEEAPEELREFVAEKSQGNPFFAEEIVRLLLSERIVIREISPTDGTTSINITEPLEAVEIPTSVQALILSRVDKLEEATRRTAQEASVIGRSFLEKVLAEISEAKKECSKYLDDLAKFEMIYEKSKLPEIEYIFRHILVRDAVYETLLKYERRKLHKAVADAMELLFPDRLKDFYALLAMHFGLAGETEREVDCLIKEGKRLQEVYSFREAKQFYEKANEKLEQSDKRFVENTIGIAAIEMAIGTTQEALVLLEKLNKQQLEPSFFAKLANIKGDILLRTGKTQDAMGAFEQSLKVYKEIGDSKGEAKIMGCIGIVHWSLGDYNRALEYLAKTLEIKERTGNTRGTAIEINNIGIIHWYRGDYDKALEYFGKSLEIIEEFGDRYKMGSTLLNIGSIHLERADYNKALEYYGKSLTVCGDIGYRLGTANALMCIGIIHRQRGDYEEALEYYRKSLEINEEIDYKLGATNALVNIGNVHRNRGNYERALEYFGKSLRICEEIGDHLGVGYCHMLHGQQLLDMSDNAGALIALSDAQDTFSSVGAKKELAQTLLYKARALIAENRQRNSYEKLAEGMKLADEVGTDTLRLLVQHTAGVLYSASGETKKAREAFERAMNIAVKMHPNIGAEAHYEYGKFLFGQWQQHGRKRDKDKAKKTLTRAKELYDYRVAHGYRRKELDEINSMLRELSQKAKSKPSAKKKRKPKKK
jgi:class 3 adenylate cyclase/tetratricopeptide (TPR) repeat protein